MRSVTTTVGPLAAASANNICLSQTPTSALTINGALATGGVATLDTARRVLITTTANESAKTFTIVGTDATGQSQTDVVTGPNATTGYSALDFKTVTSITISSAAAGALTVGTNTIASSPWIRIDNYADAQVAIGTYVTGTVNYTIQQAFFDPNSTQFTISPYQVPWINSTDSGAVNQTGNIATSFSISPMWVRVLLNSGSGTVTASIIQYGMVSY